MDLMEHSLENIYDTYSPMLYGIALQISPTQKEAEELLIATFERFYRQNLIQQTYPSHGVTLIKLTNQVACEQLKPETDFKLKHFENTPLLHRVLCEPISSDSYCSENNLTITEFRKKLREEFNLLRNPRKIEKTLSPIP